MLKKTRYLALALAALTVVLGVVVGVSSSDRFGYCVEHKGNYPTTQNDKNKTPAVNIAPGLGLYWNCAGSFANDNGVAITALATVLLTLATIALGYIAYEQYITTRRQLRAYIFVDTADFIDAPTPPLAPNPSHSGCPASGLWIKNFGTTPAYKVRHFSRVIFTPVGPDGRLPPGTLTYPSSTEMGEIPATAIGPGSRTHVSRNLGRALNAAEIQILAGAGYALVAYGRIAYVDTFGTARTTDYTIGYAGPYPVPLPNILSFLTEGNEAD